MDFHDSERLFDADTEEALRNKVTTKSYERKKEEFGLITSRPGSMLGVLGQSHNSQHFKQTEPGEKLEQISEDFEDLDDILDAAKNPSTEESWLADAIDFAEPPKLKKISLKNFSNLDQVIHALSQKPDTPADFPLYRKSVLQRLLTPTLRSGMPSFLRPLIYSSLLIAPNTPVPTVGSLTTTAANTSTQTHKLLTSEVERTFSKRGEQLTQLVGEEGNREIRRVCELVLRALLGADQVYVQGMTSIVLAVAFVFYQAGRDIERLKNESELYYRLPDVHLESDVFLAAQGILFTCEHVKLLDNGFEGIINLMADIMNYLHEHDQELHEVLVQQKDAYFMEMLITIGTHSTDFASVGAILDIYVLTQSRGLVALIAGLLCTFKLNLKRIEDINEVGTFVKNTVTKELAQNNLASMIPPEELKELYYSTI